MTKFILLTTALLIATSCRDNRPPAPTPQQSAQLNDAENMLNDMGGNEEGPEASAPGPSNTQ